MITAITIPIPITPITTIRSASMVGTLFCFRKNRGCALMIAITMESRKGMRREAEARMPATTMINAAVYKRKRPAREYLFTSFCSFMSRYNPVI
jgi:hypothetical protein